MTTAGFHSQKTPEMSSGVWSAVGVRTGAGKNRKGDEGQETLRGEKENGKVKRRNERKKNRTTLRYFSFTLRKYPAKSLHSYHSPF